MDSQDEGWEEEEVEEVVRDVDYEEIDQLNEEVDEGKVEE